MKVIFINRFFYPDHSATSQMLSDLAFQCAGWGWNVAVVTSRQRYDDPSVYLPESEIVNGVSVTRVSGTHFGRHRGLGRLLDYLSFIRGARRVLRELVEPDTIVVAKTDPPMLGLFVKPAVRRRGGRLVNWLQDVFPEVVTALSGRRLVQWSLAPLRAARNRGLRQAELNVVIGEGMRDHLITAGVPADKLRVIHNWAYDRDDDGGSVDWSELRAQWGLSGRFVVGYFGNLGRAHEYETVLGTLRALAAEPAIVFLFVGGGIRLEQLRRAVEDERLPNFVHREYVPRSMLRAALRVPDVHLVILRPELEGLIVPSKFAGAVAAGRPVIYIGDRHGDIGAMIEGGQCGYVVPVGESVLLTERIRALSRDPDAAAVMGANAEGVYRAHYRSERLFEEWRGVLDSVMGVGP